MSEQFSEALTDKGHTDAVAQWTWVLWHDQQIREEQEREKQRMVFYVDGYCNAVYNDVPVLSMKYASW